MKSFHSLILFCHYSATANSIPLLPISYPGRLASRNPTRLRLLKMNSFYEHFARTTQKTQPLYCWESIFIAPLQNGSYSAATSVFVAAVICLPSRCLAKDVHSVFNIPAFERLSQYNESTFVIKLHRITKIDAKPEKYRSKMNCMQRRDMFCMRQAYSTRPQLYTDVSLVHTSVSVCRVHLMGNYHEVY
jgi:hypothetical protein